MCVSVCVLVSFHLLDKRSAQSSDCVSWTMTRVDSLPAFLFLLSVQDVDFPLILAEATMSLPYLWHSCFNTSFLKLLNDVRVQVFDCIKTDREGDAGGSNPYTKYVQDNNTVACCNIVSRLIWD